MNLYVPGLDKGKELYFLFVKSETKTPRGLLACPVLTSYYKSGQFKTRPYDPYNIYTSPNEAILCADSFQSMYTQMLCGLHRRLQVLRIGAVFAFGLLRTIRFLQLYWKELVYELVDPVDILTPLEKSGCWNGVKATKWSESLQSLPPLKELLLAISLKSVIHLRSLLQMSTLPFLLKQFKQFGTLLGV